MTECARVAWARVASAVALGLLVACDAPSNDSPLVGVGTSIDIVIEDGSITPTGGRVEAKVGEVVIVNIDSDAVDEIHVHSDPDHEFAVVPGDDQSFTFTVDVPGQVAVESHELGRTIVQLLVR